MKALCDEIETVKEFCYLGDSGRYKTCSDFKSKIGWMKFRKRKELLLGRRSSLKMKGIIYRYSIRSAMLQYLEVKHGVWKLRWPF